MSAKKKTAGILIFLVAISIGTAWYGVWAIGNLGPRVAHAGDPPSGSRAKIAALGRLEPEDEVTDLGVPVGDRIGKILVVDGQKVKADQELALLRSHPQRKAERDLAAALLGEARARLKAESDNGVAVIKDADLAVREAESAVREAETSVSESEEVEPKDVEVQEARVRVQQLVLELAKRDLETYQNMMQVDSGTKWKLDRQLLAVRRETEELGVARTLLERVKVAHELTHKKSGTRLEAARARLDSARAKLEAARTGVAVLTTAVPVLSLAESLRCAEERLEETIIRAPRAGQVLKVLAHEGEPSGAKPLLKIGNTDQMYAVAEIYETDIGFVKKGQDATLTSSALKKPVHGVVDRIGLLIRKNDVLSLDPTAASDARVVEVRIRLDQDDAVSGLTNMQVDVELITQK